jgi:hypothetical protein
MPKTISHLLVAETSSSCWANLPFALLALLALRWLLVQADTARRLSMLGHGRERRLRADAANDAPPRAVQFAAQPGSSSSRPDSWRDYVKSPVVEHAWESLCGSIVQEVNDGRSFVR